MFTSGTLARDMRQIPLRDAEHTENGEEERPEIVAKKAGEA
jgi:hypothetical protein